MYRSGGYDHLTMRLEVGGLRNTFAVDERHSFAYEEQYLPTRGVENSPGVEMTVAEAEAEVKCIMHVHKMLEIETACRKLLH